MPTDVAPKRKDQAPDGPRASKHEKATMIIHLALYGKYFRKVPNHETVWQKYKEYFAWDNRGIVAVALLLVLSLFETPLWCNESGFWAFEPSTTRCSVPGKANATNYINPSDEDLRHGLLIMSGVPLVPIGVGMVIECILYTVCIIRLTLMAGLNQLFQEECQKNFSDNFWKQSFFVTFGFLDLALFVCMGGTSDFRIAPLARFGLAAFSIPTVRKACEIFYSIVFDLTEIGAFLVGSMVIFAWASAMLCDDMTADDPYGDKVNSGLDTFGDALYTSFVVVTTANLPDALVFSYASFRTFIWLWMPFIFLSAVVFVQVVLAVVYNCYSDKLGEGLKETFKGRSKAITIAFALLQEGGSDPISQDDFKKVIECLAPVMPVDNKLIDIIFEAIDDDNNGTLDEKEFNDVCDVVQYNYQVCTRDSPFLPGMPDWFKSMMDNGADGEDRGYEGRFDGCQFGWIMDKVLLGNVIFMLVESFFDFNRGYHEPLWFQYIDMFFSFVYIIEVVAKLLVWSWDEYWTSYDNRFDFMSTIILASGGSAFCLGLIQPDELRYINILRVLRLVKALSNVGKFKKTMNTIANMLQTCRDVLIMNLLVIYLFSTLGVSLFGGELFKGNHRFEESGTSSDDLDFFDSHFQVFSFNDMFLGFVTLFFFLLTGWIDEVASACLGLHSTYSLGWLITMVYFMTFYLAAVLLAFNVFSAFSIDVYCKLKELESETDENASALEKNLSDIQARLWKENKQLHIAASAEIKKMKVYKGMLEEDDDDDGEGDD